MLANRLSPLGLLDDVRTTFDLLEDMAGSRGPQFAPAAYPAVNAWEDDQNFYLEAEIPGLTFEQLEIFVTDGKVLTIKGERTPCACEGGKWLRRERGYGAFQRQIALPGPVDQEHVEASLKHGVLTITMPKAAEIRPRRIEVKAS